MPSRKQSARARARAWLEAEVPEPADEGTLQAVREQAAAIVREARKDASPPADTHVAGAIADHSQSYFEYLLKRDHRRRRVPRG